YHSARLDADGGVQPGTFERLLDGPAAALPLPGRTARARAQAAGGVQLAPRAAGASWHALRLGFQAARTSARVDWPGAPVTAAELLGGRAARIWTFSPGGRSQWSGSDLALYASDSMALGRRLQLEAGLRLETSGAAAAGAPAHIRWTALSPRLFARWQAAGPVALLAGWGRYRHRLPLSLAAWGDTQAPTADVFLWNDAGDGALAGGERGVRVARGGPGAPLGTLDPGLRAPRTDELVAGVEARFGRVRVAFTGVHRDERGLVESVNVGVPASAYALTTVPDPAGDLAGPQDDQLLPLYLRDPLTFGDDAFLLTNPEGHDTRHQGVQLTVELATEKVQVLLGATAHRSEGAGAFRGFRPGENDQGLVGDLFDDPNAGTHARGRLFSDRAYTIKLSGSWRAPLGFTLGAAARYQDGQPFSRLVLAALPQGLTAVQAIPNGRARFTFIATLDARLEKEIALGRGRRAAALVEGFNLTQRGNEVEEVVVSGGSYRAVTFREPPRVL
ncbi:MAG TPA: TonB-dependent receptor, partial [Vicinamibacteria bacterium]|nr:TonB-dependent receptor [Vicinamibacteria bacterium]